MSASSYALAEPQLTREEAIAFAQERRWEPMSQRERALFQLTQDRMCMPFAVFHEAVGELLGRPVWTHEFVDPASIWEEAHKRIPRADLEAVLAKLPTHVQVVVVTK